jgi:hypothetical protein
MILFEEVAMVAAQVALIGDVDRSKAVPGYSEEEKTDPGEIVEGKKRFRCSRNECSRMTIHKNRLGRIKKFTIKGHWFRAQVNVSPEIRAALIVREAVNAASIWFWW